MVPHAYLSMNNVNRSQLSSLLHKTHEKVQEAQRQAPGGLHTSRTSSALCRIVEGHEY